MASTSAHSSSDTCGLLVLSSFCSAALPWENEPDEIAESTKLVDVAAVLNSAALIVEGRSTAINSDFIQKLAKKNAHEIATLITEHDKELGATITMPWQRL